jgi:predicted nucleic acid-binding protein
LIHLSRIGRLGLLRELYAEVLVPNAVAGEVGRYVADELDAGFSSGWLRRATPTNVARVDEIERDLGGRGEAEVIAVALEIDNTIALIDEMAARTYAIARGLEVRGTLGIVVHAKRRGLIERATPLLDDLRRTGFWLDDATYWKACELASER